MKKLLIVVGFIAVSITCVNAQLFMHLDPSDSLTVVDLSMEQSRLNVGVKDSLKDLYIDDVKYDSKILDMIDPGKIESVEVIKGEAAIKEYNAPNGVLKITSRAASDKSGTPLNIRIRAVGNIDSLDRAISVHRLSDVELKSIGFVDAKDRAISVDAKDRAISVESHRNMVIVIDGKVAVHDELSKISPFDIESIKVVQGDEAMEKYNTPDAAIIVETKKKKE